MEEEAYTILKLIPNPDGSVTRLSQFPSQPDNPQPDPTQIVLSKDIPLNPTAKTFIRLFRPQNLSPNIKLAIIIYFHGGGFVLLSATSTIFHESCSQMAAKTPSLIASVEYRLAPEHRLPAAYDDAIDAINWIKDQALNESSSDPWIKEHGDFSKVFLMGSSAGGNIVYHAALRAIDLELSPVKIVGLIMNQPFFCGVARTESELKYKTNPIIPNHVSDLLWKLSLPEGADRGHVYCDPFASGAHTEKIGQLPVSVVRGYAGDPLVDKQKEFAKMLEERGVGVITQFSDGGHHGVEVFDQKFAEALYNDVRDFVDSIFF